jgi:UDP-N-acetylmuramoyl-tripeptide--D-alanyl-D-alanine ligase
MLTFAEIIEFLTGKRIPEQGPLVTEAVIDSRRAIPGSLFIALSGEQTDGHLFIQSAFEKGARMAMVEKEVEPGITVVDLRADLSSDFAVPVPPFCVRVDDCLSALQQIARRKREKSSMRVIGITGSVGKSSTKELISEVLAQKFHTFKNPGNYNNEIGLPLTIINSGRGYERLVLEMGFFYPGEINFLCGIAQPEVGVVTNIGTVHAERAGSRQAIAEGKGELIAALPPEPEGVAILNYDDPLVREMAQKTSARVLFYGLDPQAHIWADRIQGQGLKGIRFRLHYENQSADLAVPMLGRHSVQTILRACAVAFTEGMGWDEIISGLTNSNTQLRMVAVQTRSGALILDDTYNATPESTIAALDLLQELKGQRIAVLGDMLELGQYAEIGHEKVGKAAARTADHLIAVGPLSKTTAATATESGLPSTAVTWVENAAQATDVLRYNLKVGDIVLIKGSHGLRMDRISAALEEA